MTPAAPNPDGVRSLPPPVPDAASSPGPSSWAAPLPPPRVAAAIAHLPDVAGRDVGDAFELIWPTGAVDEQVLGDPLSVEQPQGGPISGTLHPSAASPSEPITVSLTPVTPPHEASEPAARTGPVPDDVVLAVQRAIAAIGTEEDMVDEPAPEAVVDEPAPVPRLPERAPADLTDARRSALKRLISGLRRR